MKTWTEHVTKLVTVETDTRTLEAEVLYVITKWLEPRPYGMGEAYETQSEFAVEEIDYLTEDLTADEKQQLDNVIHNNGPYE